jgi:hypothetical protein
MYYTLRKIRTPQEEGTASKDKEPCSQANIF